MQSPRELSLRALSFLSQRRALIFHEQRALLSPVALFLIPDHFLLAATASCTVFARAMLLGRTNDRIEGARGGLIRVARRVVVRGAPLRR